MFWSNLSWHTRICIVVPPAFMLVVALALVPVFGHARQQYSQGHYSCQSSLKQMGMGFAMYAQDYDEKLPRAVSCGGWAYALTPYVKSIAVFRCPSLRALTHSANPRSTGYTDFFYNACLQRKDRTKLPEAPRVILAAEGNDLEETTAARYAKTVLPSQWRTDPFSPAFRHDGAANYLFVDGHVKAVKVEDISSHRSQVKYYLDAQPKVSKAQEEVEIY